MKEADLETAALFTLRWTARVLALATLLLLAMFYIGEGMNIGEITPREYIGLAFFPIGLTAGFIVAWRNEFLGGVISVASIVAFYLIYGALLSGSIMQGSAFLVFGIPGLLFLIYGLLARIEHSGRDQGHFAH